MSDELVKTAPSIFCDYVHSTARQATTSFEALVAFTLLTTVLSIFAPLVVRHDRLLTTHRHYRLALDELSNQLERLSVLPPADVRQALERLTPSQFIAARLHGAELHGQLEPVDIGQRLTLQLTWDEQRRTAPVTLSAWILPEAQERVTQPNGTSEP